jgi:DNA-directed RNA polymerase I, II, and III subunit RPABC2
MSDNESDYYSDSSESDEESVKVVNKKPVVVNAAKKFGNYIEDESEIDDSEPDDADQEEEEEEEQIGGVEDNPEEIDSDNELATKEEEEDDAEPEEQDEGDSDIEIDEEGEVIEKKPKTIKPKKTTQLIIDDEDDDEDEYEENYLQKFDGEINKNYITEFHPECLNHNSDEVSKLSKIFRDENNIIVDSLHRTLPYLTKYEKARVLGQRAKQIETGAKPLVKVPENIIDGYIIAELELREKKIPFIIKRPIPGGAFEYWNLRDLEIINF